MIVETVGERLRELGWRQGVILPAAHLLETLPDGSAVSGEHHLLVVSQSCDLVHHDLEKEPHAVFLLLRSHDVTSAEFAHGRNPRVLHFTGPDGKCFEAIAWHQITISRKRLLEPLPEGTTKLFGSDLRVVTGWLAKRFTRIAFPDDFNDALRFQEGAIRKMMKKRHHLFSEILLRVEPFEDLEAGETYKLICYLLMPPEIHDNPRELAAARLVAAKLEEVFEKSGIEVLACSPVSEVDLSYAEIKELVRWDYDHLTHRVDAESS